MFQTRNLTLLGVRKQLRQATFTVVIARVRHISGLEWAAIILVALKSQAIVTLNISIKSYCLNYANPVLNTAVQATTLEASQPQSVASSVRTDATNETSAGRGASRD